MRTGTSVGRAVILSPCSIIHARSEVLVQARFEMRDAGCIVQALQEGIAVEAAACGIMMQTTILVSMGQRMVSARRLGVVETGWLAVVSEKVDLQLVRERGISEILIVQDRERRPGRRNERSQRDDTRANAALHAAMAAVGVRHQRCRCDGEHHAEKANSREHGLLRNGKTDGRRQGRRMMELLIRF